MAAEFNTVQYIQNFTVPNHRLASNNLIYVILTLLNNTHCFDEDVFDNACTSSKAINCDLHRFLLVSLRLLLGVFPT